MILRRDDNLKTGFNNSKNKAVSKMRQLFNVVSVSQYMYIVFTSVNYL